MSARMQHAATVITAPVDDSLALLEPLSAHTVVLNPTAALIWQHCEAGCTLDELVDVLARLHDTTTDAIRDDVEATVRELCRHGFLTCEDS